MHNQHSPHIDQATVDRWQADGVVLLKGVFTPWVERLAEGVTALMASPSEYGHARTVIPKDGSPPFFQDYCNWSRIPAFSEFVFQSAAAEIAAALMQSQTAKFSMSIRWSNPPEAARLPPGIMISRTIASPAGRTSASGSRWTR